MTTEVGGPGRPTRNSPTPLPAPRHWTLPEVAQQSRENSTIDSRLLRAAQLGKSTSDQRPQQLERATDIPLLIYVGQPE